MSTITSKIRNKLFRYLIFPKKLSTKNLDRLCRENQTHLRTLVVHSEDVKYEPFFSNTYTVTQRLDVECNKHMDLYYHDLCTLPENHFDVVLCTGLLEHVPDPQRLINDLHAVLKPNGKLVLSASSIFSFHEGPDNFFHFTPYGMKLLLHNFNHIEYIRGASQPFETIGILIQRILIQCDINPLARPFIELLAHTVSIFDFFIHAQYDTNQIKTNDRRIDSMLPSNVQAVAFK